MTNSEYQSNIQILVKLVKVLMKAPENNPLWDRANVKRIEVGIRRLWNLFKKSKLLEYESIENVVASCIQDIAEEHIRQGLDWSVVGVVYRNAWKWEVEKLREIGKLK